MPNAWAERGRGKLTADALALHDVPACSERWRCNQQSRRDSDENEPEFLHDFASSHSGFGRRAKPEELGTPKTLFEHFIVVRPSGNAPIRSPTSLIASPRRPGPFTSVPFAEEDESPFVGPLQVEAA
jgi:hypothetical protein